MKNIYSYYQAPPEGWKCLCVYKVLWTCQGYPIQCDEGETCPGDCFSHECCDHGGGDCGGYPSKFKFMELFKKIHNKSN